MSAEDDLYGTMRVARHAAQRIPGASVIGYPSGGHLLLGCGGDMWSRIDRFIRNARALTSEYELRRVR